MGNKSVWASVLILAVAAALTGACSSSISTPAKPITIQSPTITPTLTQTITPTNSMTLTVTFTASPTPTITNTPTVSSTPTKTATSTATPLPTLNVTGSVTLTSGTYIYEDIVISPGGTLYINGAVTLDIYQYLTAEAGGSINGVGLGYGPGLGTGGGGSTGTGGGHGGSGGDGATPNTLSTNKNDTTVPGLMGSGGGSGNCPSNSGGSGGALLWIVASGSGSGNVAVTINGTIDMDGQSVGGSVGYCNGSGGGAGGGIYIAVPYFLGNGTISANGGSGENSAQAGGGGGGGGGIIDINAPPFSGFMEVNGGAGGTGSNSAINGTAGQPGIINGSQAVDSTPTASNTPTITNTATETFTATVTPTSTVDTFPAEGFEESSLPTGWRSWSSGETASPLALTIAESHSGSQSACATFLFSGAAQFGEIFYNFNPPVNLTGKSISFWYYINQLPDASGNQLGLDVDTLYGDGGESVTLTTGVWTQITYPIIYGGHGSIDPTAVWEITISLYTGASGTSGPFNTVDFYLDDFSIE